MTLTPTTGPIYSSSCSNAALSIGPFYTRALFTSLGTRVLCECVQIQFVRRIVPAVFASQLEQYFEMIRQLLLQALNGPSHDVRNLVYSSRSDTCSDLLSLVHSSYYHVVCRLVNRRSEQRVRC